MKNSILPGIRLTSLLILVLWIQITDLRGRTLKTGLSDAQKTQIIYLSGTGPDHPVMWDFFCTGGRNSGTWTRIRVPSCWEQEGFGAYIYGVNFYGKPVDPGIPTEQGKYKLEFTIPSEWSGKRVRIVFDGVMTDTEVLINGQKAGPVHQGGFYRFKFDITQLVKFGGKNLLEVNVKKESENASVNMAERRADYWNFSGIFRPVFLESLPFTFIDRTTIDAKADGSFRAEAYLGEAVKEGYSVVARVMAADGNSMGEPLKAVIPPGSDKASVTAKLNGIKAWSAETPELYRISFTLLKSDQVVHEVTDRFGFRTFEVRTGDGFFLNGQRILLKGVNRHSFRPETGRTLSVDQCYEDAKLIRSMNMNCVRMSHYPPDPAFLDACDELGLYVLDELGGWHGKYETAVGRQLVREMVTRDVNHPSILFWDNGNEGGWNTDLDTEFARWDLSNRPVLHPQQFLSGVETMHYRSYGETQEYLRRNDIYFPTEFLHGLYDGGHGAGLYDYWEMMRNHPRSGGGLLWDLADEGVVRTDQDGRIDNDGNHGADGIVGPHHEKEGSYYTIKEIWSPVQIMNKYPGPEFDGVFKMENRFDFTNLSQCAFLWELCRFPGIEENKSGHQILSHGKIPGTDIPPHSSGNIKINLPSDWRDADVLYLTVSDPFENDLWTWSWELKSNPGDRKNIAAKSVKVETKKENGLLTVTSGKLTVGFNGKNGKLVNVICDGKTISLKNGPEFIAARRGDRTPDGSINPEAPKGVDRVYLKIPESSSLTKIVSRPDDQDQEITATYSGTLRKVTWRITPDEKLYLDYEYQFDGVVELMGITFDYPEAEMRSIRWLGRGPYRVWQNRTQGTRLDVWENNYNDPVPGETFIYPEFKGYFSDWKWASFETGEGVIRMINETPGTYLGVYTPRDGRDALLYTLPETGLGFFHVIPAVRNKVNATDLIGPSSQAQRVSGIQKGSVCFQFH